jgi:redox-sensitive bicupin YhaK (pirin superfamily)
MIELRPFEKLGSADHGWLKAKHHFSFGGHYDPDKMGHGHYASGTTTKSRRTPAFPAHPHANMEIITYVREGRDYAPGLARQQGPYRGRRRTGDERRKRHPPLRVQSGAGKTKIFQIWIEPTTQGGQPTWGAKPFPKSDRSGKLVTIASGLKGDNDALPIRADARVLATTLKAGESAEYTPAKSVTSIWCRRPAASKSTACVSRPATASRSATRLR